MNCILFVKSAEPQTDMSKDGFNVLITESLAVINTEGTLAKLHLKIQLVALDPAREISNDVRTVSISAEGGHRVQLIGPADGILINSGLLYNLHGVLHAVDPVLGSDNSAEVALT